MSERDSLIEFNRWIDGILSGDIPLPSFSSREEYDEFTERLGRLMQLFGLVAPDGYDAADVYKRYGAISVVPPKYIPAGRVSSLVAEVDRLRIIVGEDEQKGGSDGNVE